MNRCWTLEQGTENELLFLKIKVEFNFLKSLDNLLLFATFNYMLCLFVNKGRVALEPILFTSNFWRGKNSAKFWRWSHWTNMLEPKLRWLTYMSCHDIYSQENISRIACARMDRHIQVIIFAAFGLLLNFVFQSQQNNAAFLVLLMHYQLAFQRLVSAVRRRRVRLNWCR